MTDLTPRGVRHTKGKFRRGLWGYDTGRVDEFLDVVAKRLEDLVLQNAASTERADALQGQIAAFREREQAINDAMVAAQQLEADAQARAEHEVELARTEAQHEAELLRSEVRREADQLRSEAQREADQLRTEARGETERVLDERQRSSQNLTRELEGLVRRRNEFAKTFRALLERHLAEVKGEQEKEQKEEKEGERLAEPAEHPAATPQAPTDGAAADASVAQPPDSGGDSGAADAWLSSILGNTEPEKQR